MSTIVMLHETLLDPPLFEAAAQAVEQAIIAALWRAQSVTGRDTHSWQAIIEAIPDWQAWLSSTQL